MKQHFTRRTVSAAFWCGKCSRMTQHRIDDRKKGPCLDCIARLEAQHQVIDIDELRQKLRQATQRELFG